jgi:hypothetical protein
MLYKNVAACFGQFASTKAEENNNDKFYIKYLNVYVQEC